MGRVRWFGAVAVITLSGIAADARETPCGNGTCPAGACLDYGGGHEECARGYVPDPDVAMSARRDFSVTVKDADPRTVAKVKKILRENLVEE